MNDGFIPKISQSVHNTNQSLQLLHTAKYSTVHKYILPYSEDKVLKQMEIPSNQRLTVTGHGISHTHTYLTQHVESTWSPSNNQMTSSNLLENPFWLSGVIGMLQMSH